MQHHWSFYDLSLLAKLNGYRTVTVNMDTALTTFKLHRQGCFRLKGNLKLVNYQYIPV